MMETLVYLLSRYGLFGVLIAAFFEAVIFPPPVEIILLPVMLANPKKAILYSIATVTASMLGGVAGYNLGKAAGRPLIIRMFGEDKLKHVERAYEKYGVFAIITSAFTPIPYEAYTLSAGAFRMNFYRYMIATFAGRVFRYIPEGIGVYMFGHAITSSMLIYISLFGTLVIITGALYILIKKNVSGKRKSP